MAKRVLLVDDETGHGEMLANELRRCGHEVTYLSTFSEAHRRAHTEAFDVLVTDLQLDRDRNGVELAKDAKRHDSNLRVVIISASPPQKVYDIFAMEKVETWIAAAILFRGAVGYISDLRRAVAS